VTLREGHHLRPFVDDQLVTVSHANGVAGH